MKVRFIRYWLKIKIKYIIFTLIPKMVYIKNLKTLIYQF